MKNLVVFFLLLNVPLRQCTVAPTRLSIYVTNNGSDVEGCGATNTSTCLTLDYALTTVAARGGDSTTMAVYYVGGVVEISSWVFSGGNNLLQQFDSEKDIPGADGVTVTTNASSVVVDGVNATFAFGDLVLNVPPSTTGEAVVSMSGTDGDVEFTGSTIRFTDATKTTTRVLLRISGGRVHIERNTFTNFGSLLGVVLISIGENVRRLRLYNTTFTNIGYADTEDSTAQGVVNILVGAIDGTTINIQDSEFTNTRTLGNGGALFIKQMNSTKSNVTVNHTSFCNTTAAKDGGAIYYVKEDSDASLVTFLFTSLTFQDCVAGNHGQHIFVRGYNFPEIISPMNFLGSYLATEDEDYLWGATYVNGEEKQSSLLTYLVQPLLSDVYVSSNGTDVYNCGVLDAPCLTIDFANTRAAATDSSTSFYVRGTVAVSSVVLLPGGHYSLKQFNAADDPAADVVTVRETANAVVIDATDADVSVTKIIFEATPSASGDAIFAMSGDNAVLTLSNSTFRFSSPEVTTHRELIRVIAGTATIEGCVFRGFRYLFGCVLVTVHQKVKQFSISNSNFTDIGAADVVIEESNAQGILHIVVGSTDGVTVDIQNTNFTDTLSGGSGGGLFVDQWNSTRSTVHVNNSVFTNTTALDGIGGAIYYARDRSNPQLVTFSLTYLTFQNCVSDGPGYHIFLHCFDMAVSIVPANFYMSYSLTEDPMDLWWWTLVDGEPVEGSMLDYLSAYTNETNESGGDDDGKGSKGKGGKTAIIVVVVIVVVIVVAVVIAIGVVVFIKKKKDGFRPFNPPATTDMGGYAPSDPSALS